MIKNEKEFLIIYLDDDGEIKKTYSAVKKIRDNLITFETDDNNITIPIHRLLKIKEKIKVSEYGNVR